MKTKFDWVPKTERSEVTQGQKYSETERGQIC